MGVVPEKKGQGVSKIIKQINKKVEEKEVSGFYYIGGLKQAFS